MKQIFFKVLFGCFVFAGMKVHGQKLIVAEDCEVVKPNSQMDWHHSKTQGYNAWTSGSQNPDAQLSTHTLKALASGVEGAPAPLRGTKSFQHKITWLGDNMGLQYSRNELHFGSDCNDFTDTRWIQGATYLKTGQFHGSDLAPTQISFDAKFGDGGGPASFSLWVQNNRYIVQRQTNHEAPGQYVDIGPAIYDTWVSFVCERNYTDGPSGFIRLYMFVHGVDTAPVEVFEYLGANYLMACGPQSEAYYQMGIYKWNWKNENGNVNAGYPISAESRGTWYLYTDNIKFWRSSATLADITADLIGAEGPPTNQSPQANAGVNQSIVSPDTDAVMAASASDVDGTIADYTWTQVTGPNTATISDNDIEDPTMSGLIVGVYIFRLTVTDDDGAVGVDEVTITVSSSSPAGGDLPYPTNSGNIETDVPDYFVTLPTTSTTIFFYADDPDDGDPYPYDWVKEMHVTKISGPAGGDVTEVAQTGDNPTNFEVDFDNLEEGVYTYELEIVDFNGDQSVTQEFTITVVGEDNVAPTVDAGPDQYIPLDGFGAFLTKATTLVGEATDSDGTVEDLIWTVISGPENSALGSPTNDSTLLAGMIPGVYTIRLFATDNDNAVGFDDVLVYVLSPFAGADQTITLPNNSINLSATAINVADTTDVLWEIIDGPVGSSFSQSGQLSTSLNNLVEGTYTVQIKVTWDIDGTEYEVRDRLTVVVLPAATQTIRRVIKP